MNQLLYTVQLYVCWVFSKLLSYLLGPIVLLRSFVVASKCDVCKRTIIWNIKNDFNTFRFARVWLPEKLRGELFPWQDEISGGRHGSQSSEQVVVWKTEVPASPSGDFLRQLAWGSHQPLARWTFWHRCQKQSIWKYWGTSFWVSFLPKLCPL